MKTQERCTWSDEHNNQCQNKAGSTGLCVRHCLSKPKQAETGGHTPGPWHYRSAAHTKNLFGVSIFHGRDERNEGLIADLSGRYKSYRTEAEIDPVTKANARLIASAPDLLAALKGMMREFGGVHGALDPEISADIPRIAALSAIAKAEGVSV